MGITYIYQPHFNTNCFRVACKNITLGKNYVVVTCSPSYNGVYEINVTPEMREDLRNRLWMNGNLACYCIPMSYFTKTLELSEVKKEDKIKEIRKQQKKWFKSEVENRNYTYKDKPDWMI